MGKMLGGRIGSQKILVTVDTQDLFTALHGMNGFPFGTHVDLEMLSLAVDIKQDEFDKLIAFIVYKGLAILCDCGHIILTKKGYDFAQDISKRVGGRKN